MQGSLLFNKNNCNYVHQIYGLYDDNKKMSELFKKSYLEFKKWSKKNNYKYKLWGKKECDSLIKEFPKYIEMYEKSRYPIMKCDIARLCILYKYGGLYSDLDCFPKIKEMKKSNLVLTIDKTSSGTKRKNGNEVVTNEIIQASKNNVFLLAFLDYIKTQIKEKEKIEIYNVRKARFVLHTTGPYSLQRFLKKNDCEYDLYRTNQLEFEKNWKYIGLGKTDNVDFIAHDSLSWYSCLK
tara:strand:- start:88 stop:798 length:711 start_codon:yes stop_codon:yes gene_type:complete